MGSRAAECAERRARNVEGLGTTPFSCITSTLAVIPSYAKVALRLRAWLIAGQLWTCGVIRAEVMRGVRSPRIKADLNDLFDVIPEVPTDEDLWRATVELAWGLDQISGSTPNPS